MKLTTPRSIIETIAAAQDPVTLDELKTKLRILHDDLDGDLRATLRAAIKYCQDYQWAQYCTATFVERFDYFPAVITPQRCPLIDVTTLQYIDVNGTTQALVENTDFVVDPYVRPARIFPARNKSWPAIRGFVNDVILTYRAGYGDASAVPDNIKQAILLRAAQQHGGCDGKTVERVIHGLLDGEGNFKTFF